MCHNAALAVTNAAWGRVEFFVAAAQKDIGPSKANASPAQKLAPQLLGVLYYWELPYSWLQPGWATVRVVRKQHKQHKSVLSGSFRN